MNTLRGIKTVLELIMDTIVPLRPRSARTKSLSLEKIPLTPAVHELMGQTITTLMDYQKADVRDLIQSLKYDGSGHAAHLCASVLAEYLSEELSDARLFSQKRIILLPMPLHATRQHERGFNQIAIVLDSLPDQYKGGVATLIPRALIRSRYTTPQTHLSRAQRLKNVQNAFSVPNPALVRNTHVYLIDDVTTTGSTLVHAGAALKRAGAAVTLIALARA